MTCIKKPIAISSCDLGPSPGAGLAFRSLAFKNTALLSSLRLEGRLVISEAASMIFLHLSGVPGRGIGMHGPLPPALRQASGLRILTMANQQMDGGIPSFTGTLSVLALQNNRLKVGKKKAHNIKLFGQ